MKNEVQRDKTTITGYTTQNKHTSKKGKPGTRIRRLLAKNWACVEHGTSYMKAISIEACNQEICKIKNELFDDAYLRLNVRNCVKSNNVQTRILRRIIEKRQAKPIYRRIGRTGDLFVSYLLRVSTTKSINNITRGRYFA